jgi:hypothetical protein
MHLAMSNDRAANGGVDRQKASTTDKVNRIKYNNSMEPEPARECNSMMRKNFFSKGRYNSGTSVEMSTTQNASASRWTTSRPLFCIGYCSIPPLAKAHSLQRRHIMIKELDFLEQNEGGIIEGINMRHKGLPCIAIV